MLPATLSTVSMTSLSNSSTPSLPSSPLPQTPGEHSTLRVAPGNDAYVLVIGGLGFIGSHTSLELLKAGHNVIIVDNLSNSYESVLIQLSIAASMWCKENRRVVPEIQFYRLDYRTSQIGDMLASYVDKSTGKSRITGVIHFAAFKSVIESIERPLDYYQNNVCGLVHLLCLLDRYNVKRFVFSSSATVYGAKANTGVPLREEDVVHHPETYIDDQGVPQFAVPGVLGLLSPYARTKYFGEAVLADVAYADPSWKIIALRYFNPIGADSSGLLGEDPKGVPTNLFPVIAQVLTGTRPELEIFGNDWGTCDGTAVRDFIHVSDLARGHVAALMAPDSHPFRTYNLGTGTGTTVREAVTALEQAAGRRIHSRILGRRAGDVGSCVAANRRVASELNWTASTTVAQCARDLWNFVSRSSPDAPQS